MRKALVSEMLPEDGRITAILPAYTEKGDATRILLSTGEEVLLAVRTKRALELLAARHCQSLELLRRWGRRHVNGMNGLALAMAPELVLLPLRVRAPRVRGDATLGFINVALGEVRLRPVEMGTELILPTGQPIRSLWQAATVRRHLLSARLLAHQREAEAAAVFFRRFRGMFVDGRRENA
ncbi:hypothetical protein TAMA11512_01310 [Selenomonas sp. TAMA-11512]|uniref:hypothetical protein n=1 Tax=Selenomonas sp. TAMA-11512 TaxID=3095337 RepID=UPI0030860CBD|nr:hypothetical protein TAMA11512_01310 [Selenomonas sp. TAMA-11512]